MLNVLELMLHIKERALAAVLGQLLLGSVRLAYLSPARDDFASYVRAYALSAIDVLVVPHSCVIAVVILV